VKPAPPRIVDPMVGPTPWSARDALVPLFPRRIVRLPTTTSRPGGPTQRVTRQILLLLLCAPLAAQPGLKIKSESRLVLVDAVVSGKKDAAIPGLTAADFHVFEDGKEQPVTAFQSHTGPATPGMPRQHFLLLFDADANNDLQALRESASRFIADNAGPNRLLAIAHYSSGCMTLATQFAADIGELQHALGTLPSLTRRCGYVADPDGDLQAAYYAQLAKDLAHVPGHKVLVLFVANAGAEASAPARWSDPARMHSMDPAQAPHSSDARAAQLSATAPGNAARPRNPGHDPSHMEDEFRKADVSVYPVAAQAGARTPGWALHLADATGGRELNRGNDLAAAFHQLSSEQDEAYTLGYVPPESPEGTCHALKVAVDRRDVRVRARNLYCNVREVSIAAAKPSEKELENLADSLHAGDSAAAASLPYFYEPNGVARVNLAVEIPPVELHADLDVLGLAYNLADEVAARFTDTVKIESGGRPLYYEHQFKIAPGNYRFKLVYRSGKDHSGVVEAPLAIGPFVARKLSLSAIALGRDLQPISTEAAQEAAEGGQRPLVFRGNRITISGSDILSKTGLAEAYFEIYEPPASGPVHLSMRLRLLDAQSNEQKWASGDIDLSDMVKSVSSMIPVALKLPVSTLPPGTYRAEFIVKDSAGNEAARSVQFRM
jgi:VWFA-related protein